MDFRANSRPTTRDDRQPPAPRRIMRCATCGRVDALSAQDLAGYLQIGWPRCCGGVMTYYLEGDPSDPPPQTRDESTRTDHPPDTL